MIDRIIKTSTNNYSALIIRVTLGAVILPRGTQKIFAVFGGYGFQGTMAYFTETLGLPWVVGFLVILAESAGAIILIVGFLSRLAGASLALVMAGAAATHLPNGFFMNWFGNQSGEGVEFFILAIALAIQVMIQGGGKYSVDDWLSKRLHEKNNAALGKKFETSF
jgi:putative oxidoreductase